VSGSAGAATDFDIYLVDDAVTVILAFSIANNIGNDPVEVLTYTNQGAGAMFNIIIDRFVGFGEPLLKYIYTGNMQVNEYETNSSTVFGHANADSAFAIGAANYQNTPAFGTNPPLKAPYSSKGGTPILFDGAGNPIDPVIRTKPDFTCVDNGNTTFFIPGYNPDSDGWPNFNGTSAAASHAAALTALIKQYGPSLTPQEVYAAIVNNAIDMETPGFDYFTGYGLCDATAALASIEPPDISLSVTPSPLTLPEPGGDVTYGITVSNIGDVDATLTELSDDEVGNLDGLGNCSVPQSLVASTGSYSCSYTRAVSGNAGDEITREIMATIEDDELNTVDLADDVSVFINSADIIFRDGFESD